MIVLVPDFEFTPSLLQLLAGGLFRGHQRNQLIACGQHIEVRDGDSQREILLRLGQLRFALHDGELGLIKRRPILRAIYRDCQVQAAAVDAVIAADRGKSGS